MTDSSDSDATTLDGPTTNMDCLCRLDGIMDLLSRRYAIQLICVVNAIGPARYGEIDAAFGEVSSSTLSTRLDDLVSAGILDRQQYAEIPPRVEYELTETGAELGALLEPLLRWADTVDDEISVD